MSEHKDRRIPATRMPTREELRASTAKRWAALEPLLLSRLAPEILRLSMATMFHPLPMDEVEQHWRRGFDGEPIHEAGETLARTARTALHLYPAGFFFKLESRSPKDFGITRFTADNLASLVDHVFGSERILDDLCLSSYHSERVCLCFREWVDLSDEQRVFVKGGAIQGTSRYDYLGETPPGYDEGRVARIMQDAGRYLELIGPHLSIPDYVIDFGYRGDGSPILIELNPYGYSDPCCFGSYDRISGYARELREGESPC